MTQGNARRTAAGQDGWGSRVRYGWPLLGSVVPFMADPLGFLTGLHRRAGDIAAWRLGPSKALLVAHPDQVGEVLGQVEDTFDFPDLGRSFKVLTGQGVATSRGEEWRRKRATVMPSLRPQRVEAYSRIMVDRTVEHLGRWSAGDRIDVHAEVRALTRDIAVNAIFGSADTGSGAAIEEALDVAQRQVGADFRGVSAVLPGWLPTPGRSRLRTAVATLDAEVARLVAAHRAAPGAAGSAELAGSAGAPGAAGENLLTRLLDARDADGEPLPEQEVRDEAITFYVAGHATTAATLTWALYLLSRSPEALERLHAEVDAVLGDRVPDHGDYASLVWTGQVVRETLRLYPPSWSLAHIAAPGARLAGRPVERGTLVFTSPWVTQRDPRWFADPEAFRPQRWDAGGEASVAPEHAWFPFGGGPRICPGARYASVKAVLVLATLARRFRLDVDAHDNPPYPGLTAHPRDPMPATVRVRRGAR